MIFDFLFVLQKLTWQLYAIGDTAQCSGAWVINHKHPEKTPMQASLQNGLSLRLINIAAHLSAI
jgi:hypothetical protein